MTSLSFSKTAAFSFVAFSLHASAWSPGVYTDDPSQMASSGFQVDTSDRNDVISFWHGVYQASEGYHLRPGIWQGASPTALGQPGANHASLVRDTERRLNYFRAMAGVPANTRLNNGSTIAIISGPGGDRYQPSASTTKALAAQRSAEMMAYTYPINLSNAASHDPPNTNLGWSQIAWHGSAKSNLAIGFFGPSAINSYVREHQAGTGGENVEAGHRRDLLASSSTNFATGDTPGFFDPATNAFREPTNALYVRQKPEEIQPPHSNSFVSYPSEGYFPAPLNTPYWSLSRAGADFSNAKVSMKDANGRTVAVKINPSRNFGDPGLVWTVASNASVSHVEQDTTFHVTVSGIAGNDTPPEYNYSVTLINPDQLTSDQALTGTDAPPAQSAATYLFAPPSQAEALEINVFQTSTAAWTENAEDPTTSRVIDRTSPSHNLITSFGYTVYPFPAISGKAFHLTFPAWRDPVEGIGDQIIELDRELLPLAGSSLSFKYKRGLMTPTTFLQIEHSSDGGIEWLPLGEPIAGKNDSQPDAAVLTANLPLPASQDTPVRIRFRFSKSPDGLFYANQAYSGTVWTQYPVGIFIDDITTQNTPWLDLKQTNIIPAGAGEFSFDASSLGAVAGTKLQLRMRTKLGNRWFPYGPSKIVTPTSQPLIGFDAWLAYTYPDLTQDFDGDDFGDGVPNGIKYAFSIDPRSPSLVTDTVELSTASAVTRDTVGDHLLLRRPLPEIRPGITYGAEWSDNLEDWSDEGVQVSLGGGEAVARVPRGQNGSRFIRWAVRKD